MNARETIADDLRRHLRATGYGEKYFAVLIEAYEAEIAWRDRAIERLRANVEEAKDFSDGH